MDNQIEAVIRTITFSGEDALPSGLILDFPSGTNKDIVDYLAKFTGKLPVNTINTINSIDVIKETRVGGGARRCRSNKK